MCVCVCMCLREREREMALDLNTRSDLPMVEPIDEHEEVHHSDFLW